jgi:hypothetical protein
MVEDKLDMQAGVVHSTAYEAVMMSVRSLPEVKLSLLCDQTGRSDQYEIVSKSD